MSVKSVIPTPPGQRWLDFRIQWLPGIVFVCVILVTVFVWKQFVFPSSLVGRVESVRADVSHTTAATVTKIMVTRFQRVNAGDPVAEIAPVDPKILAANLAVIRADIELLRSGVNPVATSQRTAISYDSLRLDWLRQKVELATIRKDMQLADIQLQRTEKLWQEKLVPEANYDTAKTERDSLKISLEEQVQLVASLEESLRKLNPASETAMDTTNQLRAAIKVEEEKLRLTEAEMAPRVLTAPISGIVSAISKWTGETAGAAAPIMTINSTNCERVIAYLRQPFYINPETNMLVRVRSRGLHRQSGQGRIITVGEQLLPITDVLLPPTRFDLTENGLPILVTLPPEVKKVVRPGEFVDMTIVPNGKNAGR